MNRALIGILCLLIGFLLGAMLFGLVLDGNASDPVLVLTPELYDPTDSPDDAETASPAQSERDRVLQLAMYVTTLLREEDYAMLSRLIHPDYGVIFSPYATVSLTSDLCFTPSEVAGFQDDGESYMWGQYDGTGDPIELTPEAYMERFVWDRDYTEAPVVSYNRISETGNALENVEEVFPDAQFVEFHFPDDGDKHDWRTLRLVFEPYEDTYVLTAVIHSEWTV